MSECRIYSKRRACFGSGSAGRLLSVCRISFRLRYEDVGNNLRKPSKSVITNLVSG